MKIKFGISTQIIIGISALLFVILSISAYTLFSWASFSGNVSSIANENLNELSVSSDSRRLMSDISLLFVKLDKANSGAELRVLKNNILNKLDQLEISLSLLKDRKSVSTLKQHLTIIKENTFKQTDSSQEVLKIQRQLSDINSEILLAHQFIVKGLFKELSNQDVISKIRNWYEMFDQLTNDSVKLPGLSRSFEIKQNITKLAKESELLVTSFPFTNINPDTFKMINKLGLLVNNPETGLLALVVKRSELVAAKQRLNTQNLVVVDEALILTHEVFESVQRLTKSLAVQLEKEVKQSRSILIVIGILSFLIFLGFYLFVQKNVIRRLASISLTVQNGYEGKLSTIYDDRQDEIGDIARSIQQFMDKIFKQQNELQENESHLRKVIELSPQAIFIFEGIEVLFANSKAQEFIKSSPNNNFLYFSSDLFKAYEENLDKIKAGRQINLGRFSLSGNKGWISVEASPIIWSSKNCSLLSVTNINSVVKNENRLRESIDHFEEMAHKDALTLLNNRRRFDEVFEDVWNELNELGNSFTLIILDVDNFKPFNDQYGHTKGDECLRAVATAISQTMQRPSDFCARFGGEEFVCLLPHMTGSGASQISENLRINIENLQFSHKFSSASDVVTVSIGYCSISPGHGLKDRFELLKIADKNMYMANGKGRNRVEGKDIPHKGSE